MSDTVQSKTVVLSALFTQHRDTAGSTPLYPAAYYVSTFILLHSHWKIKPVFYFEKYDRKSAGGPPPPPQGE